jgi:hypothetical protein
MGSRYLNSTRPGIPGDVSTCPTHLLYFNITAQLPYTFFHTLMPVYRFSGRKHKYDRKLVRVSRYPHFPVGLSP